MFWRPRNEQNKSGYFFFKHPVEKKNVTNQAKPELGPEYTRQF